MKTKRFNKNVVLAVLMLCIFLLGVYFGRMELQKSYTLILRNETNEDIILSDYGCSSEKYGFVIEGNDEKVLTLKGGNDKIIRYAWNQKYNPGSKGKIRFGSIDLYLIYGKGEVLLAKAYITKKDANITVAAEKIDANTVKLSIHE